MGPDPSVSTSSFSDVLPITLAVLVDRNSSLTLLRAEWSDDKEQEHYAADCLYR